MIEYRTENGPDHSGHTGVFAPPNRGPAGPAFPQHGDDPLSLKILTHMVSQTAFTYDQSNHVQVTL